MGLYKEALERFYTVFERAKQTDLYVPEAMTLATADKDGKVSSRTVLMKGFDEQGVIFYTNTLSRKGKQLASNPYASVTFFWQPLKEQVQIEGRVVSVSHEDADAYWVTRPRDSQIGAWASLQSEELDGRETLVSGVKEVEALYGGKDVPRPEHWSGYCVIPERIEFWVNGEARLHQRTLYEQIDGEWDKKLLYP